jgi:hypothetical protein
MKPFSINNQTASPVEPVCLRRLAAFLSRRGFCVTNECWDWFVLRFMGEKEKASISPGDEETGESNQRFLLRLMLIFDRATRLGKLVLCRAEMEEGLGNLPES